MNPVALMLAIIFALLTPLKGLAADGAIHIYVGAPGRNKVPIAIPKPIGEHSKATDFYGVVTRDLELSGWFDVIDPNAFIEPATTGIMPGQFKFEDWDVSGAVALAKMGITSRGGGQMRAEVWVYDVPGRRRLGATALTVDEGSWRPLAHRLANEIIYQVTGQKGPFNTRFTYAKKSKTGKEIGVVDFDGHGSRSITKNGSINIKPLWHPGGSQISFTSYREGNPDLYVAKLGAGKIKRISSRMGINIGGVWSPDGKTMAVTLSPDGNPDVYLIDPLSGRSIKRLTHSAGIDVGPSWAPDGSRIAFVSERSGGAQVYTINPDGTDVRRVTFQGNFNTDPVWSPDGSQIAFVGRNGGHFDVFVVNIDGSGMRRITQDMGDNEDPSWSPDGNYVAFSSTRTGAAHIWMSTADGHHQAQLTRGSGGFLNPNWSPSLEW
jgi:TolB protein